jgi:CPA2 family monovalent cation:H+ antiporter-2
LFQAFPLLRALTQRQRRVKTPTRLLGRAALHQDVSLIALIAWGFVLAGVFGYAADRLHLPALVGYLLAGVFIGPLTPGFVGDPDLASQLAEIGVILLMFGVGLHFSTSDLLAVRRIAIPGAIGQIVLATLAGMAVAWFWGWGIGGGLVFGLSISVASTVVLLKELEERNLVPTRIGRVAVGWLIVEDLAMVLALVIVPTLATTMGGHVPGAEHDGGPTGLASLGLTLGITLAKVVAFTLLAMLVGPRVVPWVLIQAARTGSRELFTLAVLAIAMGIAFGASSAFGVSFALGAFFAGVIMSESQLSHRAAENSLPLQNAFSVLFFVSIGMLFDPWVLVQHPVEVLITVLLIVVGKYLIGVAVVLLLRYPVDMALRVGASLSQIGEFSFILAALGVALGLMPADGRDYILAGSILSIMLNRPVFAFSDRLQKWVHARWPSATARFGKARLSQLAEELERVKSSSDARAKDEQQRITELIGTFPLLERLDEDAQEELLLLFRPSSASPGQRVIRAGERGDSMHFIASGAVEVALRNGVVRLEAGSFFGEMALLTGERRSADVTAVDFCQFQTLTRRDFNQFMRQHPELRAAVSGLANERRAANLPSSQPDPA